MAEAVAAIGLASALVSFVDFSARVIRQLRRLDEDVNDYPRVFQGVRTRLPLMIDLVKKIMLQMDAGLVDKATQGHMLPIVRSCAQHVQELDDIVQKYLPDAKDSTWRRGRKVVLGVMQEDNINKLDQGLKQNFDLLLQAGTFQSFQRLDEKGHGSGSFTMNPVFNVNVNVDELMTTTRRRSSALETLAIAEEMRRRGSQPTQSLFTVPFSRDANFLGRQSVLDDIAKKFETQRYVSLAGLGGIGKSQIAIEYGYQFKESNPDAHVFWVYAGNQARFEQGYQNIARKLAIDGWDDDQVDTLELVCEWLSDQEQSGKYLLVLDNADDASLFFRMRADGREFSNEREFSAPTNKLLARYLPNAATGNVLITTRDKRVGERLSSREKAIEVSFMSPADCVELLRSKVMEEDWDEPDAKRLVKELSYLPLAITQAAAFVSENSCPINEYLDALHSGKEDLEELLSEHLEDDRRERDTENSVMRTWKLSFDQISRTMPRAAEMLSLLAVLDLQGAPQALLRRTKEYLTGFRTALGALQAFSLITAGRGKDALCKMHRLVAISTQKWLEAHGTLSHWQSEAVKLLDERFPESGWSTPDEWPWLEVLVPHTQVVFSYPLSGKDDLLTCAHLLGSCALFDMVRGKYEDCTRKGRRALQIRSKHLNPLDPLTLDSENIVGEALLHRGLPGDLLTAKQHLTKAVEGREKVLGPLDEDTLESLSDLTITTLAMDEADAAMLTAERALKGREEVLGADAWNTIVSRNVLAIALQRKGSLEEARALTEKVLRSREELLGPEHYETLITLNNFARLHIELGELDTAEAMLERTLMGEANVVGSEGYDAQVTMSNMALVLQKKGDFEEAETILRKVLALRTKSAGPEHPSTVLMLIRLLELFEAKGDEGSIEMMTMRMKGLGVNTQAQVGALQKAGLLFD